MYKQLSFLGHVFSVHPDAFDLVHQVSVVKVVKFELNYPDNMIFVSPSLYDAIRSEQFRNC